jgi:hypothetical protein
MASARGVFTAALVAAFLGPGTAAADLYRCPGPDGSTVFTDNPNACSHAVTHEPSGALQRVPGTTPSRAGAAAPAPDRAELAREAEADTVRAWREKKRRSEEELRGLDAQREQLLEYVTWCNRGGELIRRDASGLNRKVSCGRVRDELEALESRRAEVQAYLDEGLEEECRRAGCLPGWIR